MTEKGPKLYSVAGGKETPHASENTDRRQVAVDLLRTAFARFSKGKIYTDDEIEEISKVIMRKNGPRRKNGIKELQIRYPELSEFLDSV